MISLCFQQELLPFRHAFRALSFLPHCQISTNASATSIPSHSSSQSPHLGLFNPIHPLLSIIRCGNQSRSLEELSLLGRLDHLYYIFFWLVAPTSWPSPTLSLCVTPLFQLQPVRVETPCKFLERRAGALQFLLHPVKRTPPNPQRTTLTMSTSMQPSNYP